MQIKIPIEDFDGLLRDQFLTITQTELPSQIWLEIHGNKSSICVDDLFKALLAIRADNDK
jgi:hypothetical protein